jgi:hypothetical protein
MNINDGAAGPVPPDQAIYSYPPSVLEKVKRLRGVLGSDRGSLQLLM